MPGTGKLVPEKSIQETQIAQVAPHSPKFVSVNGSPMSEQVISLLSQGDVWLQCYLDPNGNTAVSTKHIDNCQFGIWRRARFLYKPRSNDKPDLPYVCNSCYTKSTTTTAPTCCCRPRKFSR